MKKLVPDPPPVLCIRPGLSHEEAVRNAMEHLNSALAAASSLPDPPLARHRALLSDALLDLRIAKALLSVALTRSTVSVPV